MTFIAEGFDSRWKVLGGIIKIVFWQNILALKKKCELVHSELAKSGEKTVERKKVILQSWNPTTEFHKQQENKLKY